MKNRMGLFYVFRNDRKVGQVRGSQAAMKKWIKDNVLSTHMGEWFLRDFGYEYATTIGEYYEFRLVTEKD